MTGAVDKAFATRYTRLDFGISSGMVINKSNCLYGSLQGLEQSILWSTIKDHTELVAETRHIISGLSSLLESRRLEMALQSVEEALALATSIESLADISASLRRVRVELRGVCRRSASSVSGGWQSPAMESSLDASILEDAERMIQSGIDYHRAAHLAGIDYESRFQESLFEQHKGCRVLTTSCGMGAITTALQYLAGKLAEIQGPVVVDDGCYHETRFLVESLFHSRLQYLDLTSADVVTSLRDIKPSLVIFDSTRNSRKICLLPVADIMAAVEKARSYLLVDSTSLVSAEPIISVAKANRVLDRTLVATSLAKMHQYGMDTVTAGALIYDAGLDEPFPGPKTFRTHLGMNISEDSAVILPAPSLFFLRQRASRISRNVEALSSALRAAMADLSVETAMCWGEANLYAPYFNISISRGDEVAWYRAFMSRVMESARRRGVPLFAGTSFGFDVTRIYLVESLIPSHRPFIRVSPGMESAYEVTLLAEALTEAAQGESL